MKDCWKMFLGLFCFPWITRCHFLSRAAFFVVPTYDDEVGVGWSLCLPIQSLAGRLCPLVFWGAARVEGPSTRSERAALLA